MQINGAEKVMEKALQSWCSLCAPQGYWEGRYALRKNICHKRQKLWLFDMPKSQL